MYTWIKISSGADLAQLEKHISPEYGPVRVAQTLANGNGISRAVKAMLIEKNYIDKDYRSTYYSFYAKKGHLYRADCVRLHFFDETVTFDEKTLKLSCADNRVTDHYFGYMVLRPTGTTTIGRTVLSPDVRSGASGLIIAAYHKVHLLGLTLTVQGFPSMDQHRDIAVCAHVACWSILRHYSERHNVYREFLTQDITRMAHEFNPGGLVPSKGLMMAHAERVFQEAGTFPVVVTRGKSGTSDLFYWQLSAYVESGFPLFVAMPRIRHAVAVVGYEWRPPVNTGMPGMRHAWSEINSLAVVDDNQLPYLSVPRSITGGSFYSAEDIEGFIVALPEKVYYPADAVYKLAPTLFKLGMVVGLPPADETIIRYFITTGSALRRFVRKNESEFDPKLLAKIMTLPFAQFVWVVEFATEAQWALGKIEGRAVIDATASLIEDIPFWLLHGRTKALIFDRQQVGTDSGMEGVPLSDMGITGFTRMEQNLRPTQTK